MITEAEITFWLENVANKNLHKWIINVYKPPHIYAHLFLRMTYSTILISLFKIRSYSFLDQK